nr:Chain I, TRYPSIN INHIBITOR II [Ecballium elaterium]
GCPRILIRCKQDSDCLAGCVCTNNKFCGSPHHHHHH